MDIGNLQLTQNAKPLPDETSERADRVWFRLSEIFGARWYDTYGDVPPRMWILRINELTDKQIATGLDRLSVKLNDKGQAFMPNLPEFVGECEYRAPYAHLQIAAPEYGLNEARASAVAAGCSMDEVMDKTVDELDAMRMRARFG